MVSKQLQVGSLTGVAIFVSMASMNSIEDDTMRGTLNNYPISTVGETGLLSLVLVSDLPLPLGYEKSKQPSQRADRAHATLRDDQPYSQQYENLAELTSSCWAADGLLVVALERSLGS
jgi:hypothetical protein